MKLTPCLIKPFLQTAKSLGHYSSIGECPRPILTAEECRNSMGSVMEGTLSYDGSMGPIFGEEHILLVEADALGPNCCLGSYEGLYAMQGRSCPFPDEVASN